MAAEGKLREKLKARVEAYGGEIRAVSWLGRRNAPDVLALFPAGGHYDEMTLSINYGQEMLHPWIETKGTKKLSTAQAREHATMREAGCIVIVCRNEQELDEWLPPA